MIIYIYKFKIISNILPNRNYTESMQGYEIFRKLKSQLFYQQNEFSWEKQRFTIWGKQIILNHRQVLKI